MRPLPLWPSLLCVLALSACSGADPEPSPGPDPDACPETGNGVLHVRFPGASSSLVSIQLRSPAGALERVTGDSDGRRLELPAGPYELLALEAVRASTETHPYTRNAYHGVPRRQTVCVKDGETVTAQVQWWHVGVSHKLWTPPPLMAFFPDWTSTPDSLSYVHRVLSPGVLTNPTALAFDRLGNLWVADSRLYRFPVEAFDRMSASEPDIEAAPGVTLEGAAIRGGAPGPVSLAFDREGSLWAGIGFSKKVIKLTPEQLESSGEPVPTVELSGLPGVGALAFDAAGNLWVGADDRVVRIDAGRLGASTDTQDLVLELKTEGPAVNTLGGAEGLAFDAAGNLFVSFFGPNVIAKLTPAQQAGTGTQVLTPVQVKLEVTALLGELAFDHSGGLWTAYSKGKLGRLSPEQFDASGTKAPALVVEHAELLQPKGLAMFPAPPGLPLFHSLREWDDP